MKFRSRWILCSMMTRMRDALPPEKQSSVVYWMHCSCCKVYIKDTSQRLEGRIEKHQDACNRGIMETSAVVEHCFLFPVVPIGYILSMRLVQLRPHPSHLHFWGPDYSLRYNNQGDILTSNNILGHKRAMFSNITL